VDVRPVSKRGCWPATRSSGAYNVKGHEDVGREVGSHSRFTAMSDLTPLWEMTGPDCGRGFAGGPQIAAGNGSVAEWMESYAPVFGFEGSDKEPLGGSEPVTTPEAPPGPRLWNDEGVKETRRVVLVGSSAARRIRSLVGGVGWRSSTATTPSFIIEDRGPYYRIDCAEGLEVDLDEIEPIIGHSYNVFELPRLRLHRCLAAPMTVGKPLRPHDPPCSALEEEVPGGLKRWRTCRLIPLAARLVLRITEVEPLYRWEILRGGTSSSRKGASILGRPAAERDAGKIAKLLARPRMTIHKVECTFEGEPGVSPSNARERTRNRRHRRAPSGLHPPSRVSGRGPASTCKGVPGRGRLRRAARPLDPRPVPVQRRRRGYVLSCRLQPRSDLVNRTTTTPPTASSASPRRLERADRGRWTGCRRRLMRRRGAERWRPRRPVAFEPRPVRPASPSRPSASPATTRWPSVASDDRQLRVPPPGHARRRLLPLSSPTVPRSARWSRWKGPVRGSSCLRPSVADTPVFVAGRERAPWPRSCRCLRSLAAHAARRRGHPSFFGTTPTPGGPVLRPGAHRGPPRCSPGCWCTAA